jgi:hypothetical protein
MGEVYRARDTRLDRTVAIKVTHAARAHGRDYFIWAEAGSGG